MARFVGRKGFSTFRFVSVLKVNPFYVPPNFHCTKVAAPGRTSSFLTHLS